ncbi:MAG TPA: ribbon-helix-helix domain-containing protein [Opitutales bacterium]|nr:ribbon-helix-helix domain-containing protein [Opitutales bacterium]
MHRTTILLPEKLKGEAEQQARREGLSLSELIRRRLSESIDAKAKSPPAFFSRRPWSGDMPTDLSARHDDYLYGE